MVNVIVIVIVLISIVVISIVAIVVFILSKRIGKNSESTMDRSSILEKAREAKLAKSILKKSENEESTTDSGE
jgi:Tfp pilus assembly protein PilX